MEHLYILSDTGCCGNNGRGCRNLDQDPEKIQSCDNAGCNKLETYDYLNDVPLDLQGCDMVEVRFKNTRKGFFKVTGNLVLKAGDIVAVESSPGHDIGVISLTGHLVNRQMVRLNQRINDADAKKVYRKARAGDIEKWKAAIAREYPTMIEARKIASGLKLDMKIGDVEYQGDGGKGIFYYIAEDRVDFRELIRKLADRFKVRIEMKQIGARQEAGRIGGIGACGRELCCGSYITNFVSVSTAAARYQGVSLNPQKLAGQCGKLKCCLNYEVDAYIDASKDFPETSVPLDTEAGPAYHLKTDVFKALMWYSYSRDVAADVACLSVDKVKAIQEMNRNGIKAKKLETDQVKGATEAIDYVQVGNEGSITRFVDKPTSRPKRFKKRNKRPQSK